MSKIKLENTKICRFCGEEKLNLINFYSEEATENDILTKITLHLPVNITDDIDLPMESCSECNLIIINWDKFLHKVCETTQKLTEFKITVEDTDTDNLNESDEFLQSEESYNIIEKEEMDVSPLEEIIIVSSDKTNRSKDVDEMKTKKIKIRRKKMDIEKRFFCEVCDKGFTRKFDMERHKKSHNIKIKIETKPNKELIAKCKKIENGKIYFKCDICDLKTNTSYNLTRHRTIHSDEKDYICHICGLSFRLKSSLRRHLEHHEGVKNFECDICFRKFAKKAVLVEHKNIHTNERPFSCDICDKSFRQHSSLYIHKLYHEQNFKYSCSICDKKYRRAQELTIHHRLHTGERPFSCDVCDYKFRRSQDLTKHQRIHRKENKEWSCDECKCVFSKEVYLQHHKKVHE